MEYNINKMAKLAGITTRTLRYYDEIGLLSPQRISSNDYRVYGPAEVDLLQQIMFYRELGISLEEIKQIVKSKDYDSTATLKNHLFALRARKDQLELLITNVEKTIAATKGEFIMSDKEKFEGFKQQKIEENEAQYGGEIRGMFGDAVMDSANAKMMGLTSEAYAEMQNLSVKINDALKTACAQGDPASDLAQQLCAWHREWLGYSWSTYSKEAHLGLAQMYLADERFREYYDVVTEGGTEFLVAALEIYCQ